jgi:CO/xanthine dehydrogenase Mo-binding subunit
VEGGIGFALGALYCSEIELKAGRPQQRNFDPYRSLRIYEMPAYAASLRRAINTSARHPSATSSSP